jgi:membrane protein
MLESLNTQKSRIENWLLSEFNGPQNALKKAAWRTLRISYAVVKDIAQGDITLRAMSLVYTTILSVVPLLALSFSLLALFNVQDQFTPMLYQFFEPMGDKGLEIYDKVMQFVSNLKVGVLGVIGLVMLLYTVLSLIKKVEEALNNIWYAPSSRSLARRFSNYLSALFLGPIVIMLAVSLTAATSNLAVVQALVEIEPFGSLFLFLTKLAPFFTIIMGFFFFYLLMPNARVHLSSALVGAVVSGVAWQVMSIAFASFVVGSAKYDAVYSGFAVGIVLLIWLYMNWLILLLGSSIAFYFQHGNYVTKHDKVEATPELAEELALKVMMDVARAYDIKQEPLEQRVIEETPFIPGILTRKIVDRLIEARLLLLVGDKSEQLAPARSTDMIFLSQIYAAIRSDRYDLHKHLNVDPSLRKQTDQLNTLLDQVMGKVTLRSMISEEVK